MCPQVCLQSGNLRLEESHLPLQSFRQSQSTDSQTHPRAGKTLGVPPVHGDSGAPFSEGTVSIAPSSPLILQVHGLRTVPPAPLRGAGAEVRTQLPPRAWGSLRGSRNLAIRFAGSLIRNWPGAAAPPPPRSVSLSLAPSLRRWKQPLPLREQKCQQEANCTCPLADRGRPQDSDPSEGDTAMVVTVLAVGRAPGGREQALGQGGV